jgi:hypothetical protein
VTHAVTLGPFALQVMETVLYRNVLSIENTWCAKVHLQVANWTASDNDHLLLDQKIYQAHSAMFNFELYELI